MNDEQVTGQARILISALVMYVVGKGWLPEGLAPTLIAFGVVAGLMLWSYITHTISAMVHHVQKSDDVKQVIGTPALVLAVDSPKVVTQ